MGEQIDWLAIVRELVTEDDWRKVVKAAVDAASKGDRYARDFLSSCVLPKERDASNMGKAKEVRIVMVPPKEE